MSRLQHSLVVAILLATIDLAGCGKSEPKPPPKVEDTVFRDLVAAQDKIKKDTEKAMAERKEKLDDALKKSEEPATP